MELFFKIEESGDGVVYIPINNGNVVNNIIKEFEGTMGETLRQLNNLDIYHCIACLSLHIVPKTGENILLVVIKNKQQLLTDRQFSFDDSILVSKNSEPNIIWDKILETIDNLTTELDRIKNIVQ